MFHILFYHGMSQNWTGEQGVMSTDRTYYLIVMELYVYACISMCFYVYRTAA